MNFVCINICWAPRDVLKPEPERWGFQHLTRGPADVNVSEKHVWSLLLHKTFFSLETFGKLLQKVLFTYTYSGGEKHGTCERFENAASRAKTNIIATVHFTDNDVSFYNGTGMLIRKTAKPCIKSTRIALLIHGFVLVKTWLLIACNTDFYAMISINTATPLARICAGTNYRGILCSNPSLAHNIHPLPTTDSCRAVLSYCWKYVHLVLV